ncbi:PREDICTED: leukocyte immunoglobulin-like receptor subfamily A member 6, partial [Myotis davidii]|uniref:leukocyte immunoglobulin-like receptor subfamily A member 6 n=1 Tax=Myotis davidii TaxID=225400 RepID=UPI0007674927
MEAEWRIHAERWQAIFPLGPVSPSPGLTYSCYGSSSSYPNVWSQPSAPLHIKVTGVHREPTLSAQPGSLVLPGHSLTLQCHAEAGFDSFALTKDEGLTHPQHLYGQHSPDFPLGHVNHTHGGRYRYHEWNLIILIGVSVALVLLLSLLLFLFLRFRHQSKGSTS